LLGLVFLKGGGVGAGTARVRLEFDEISSFCQHNGEYLSAPSSFAAGKSLAGVSADVFVAYCLGLSRWVLLLLAQFLLSFTCY